MVDRLESRRIVSMRVDATSYEDATERIVQWARAGEARHVCIASVHMVMEAHADPGFQAAVEAADLVTPDGVPLVWGLRLLGIPAATRVYGPTLTPVVCERAAREGVPVGFYGGTPEVLRDLTHVLRTRFPALQIVYQWSPPFRPLSEEEERRVVEAIDAAGPRILFVGIGCPKQERWMARHKGRIRAVMLGVGAAFDFVAGHKRQAPPTLQRLGMEWAFRLATEPRRLWRRYLRQNPRFIPLFAAQLLGRWLGRDGRGTPGSA